MIFINGCQTSKLTDWLQGHNNSPKAILPPSQATRGPLPASHETSPVQPLNSPETIQFPFEPPTSKKASGTKKKLSVGPSSDITTAIVPQLPESLPQAVKNSATTKFPENRLSLPPMNSSIEKMEANKTFLSNTSPIPPQPILGSVRVALLLPLSGSNAKLGQSMLNAAQLAVFNFSDQNFELLVHDTFGTPEGASLAANKAINDGAVMILGPLLAASVRAVGPIAQAFNIPVAAFSSDRSVVGNGTFTMGFLPSAEIWRIVTYAQSKGIKRFAALVPNNIYGETIISSFEAVVESNGGTVNRVQYFDTSDTDYSPAIRQLADYDVRRAALINQRKKLEEIDNEVSRRALKRLESLQTIGDLPFDALLIAAGGKRLFSIAALLPFYDIDPGKIRMLGTGQWDVPGLGTEPALIDGWFAAPSPKARENFINIYKAAYGVVPPRLATLAYDATALAAVLGRGEGEPDFSINAITKPSGYWGRDGIFRFLPSGIVERGLAVMKVGRSSAKVLSRAPETFQAQMN